MHTFRHVQPLSILFSMSALALFGIVAAKTFGDTPQAVASVWTCGNGVVDWNQGEECDYAQTCAGVQNGQRCDCTALCKYCSSPNPQMCKFTWPAMPPQSSSSSRPIALPICGNGIKEGAEACDLGDYNGPVGKSDCSQDCTINRASSSSKASSSKSSTPKPVCGNGIVEGSEQCDAGDLNGQTECSAKCKIVPPPPVCGNGVKEKGETCDLGDGNGAWPSTCSTACKINKAPKPVCGNGIKEGSEQCDSGDLNGQLECTSKCKIKK